MVDKVLVSACLLGEACRYDGKDNISMKVLKYLEGKEIISICPEVMGGLETPRSSCEIMDGKVMNAQGEDKTSSYLEGAQKVLAIAKENHCHIAILKSRSPSCGSKRIYDGTFQRKLIRGNGVCAKLLKENGICVLSEEEF